MNLENSLKFHFCKSSQLNDSPRSTSSETLTGTDVMAGMGMVQQRAKMGFSAFMGKMGVSSNDREKAIELLTAYALERCDKVAALRKLDSDIKPKVMQVLATFAFADYSRSAASKRNCDCCGGKKFIEAEVATMKFMGQPHLQERREVVRVLCQKCNGAGELSNSCRCHGKGLVLDEEKTKQQGGIPVYKTCPRCSGRGYSRLLPDSVRKIICETLIDIPETTWRRSYKDFFENLVTECLKQEEYANQMLIKVTK